MKKVLVGTGIFAAGMVAQKELAKFIRDGVAKEHVKDDYASMNSRYEELKRDHPKTYKIARCVSNVVVFFV